MKLVIEIDEDIYNRLKDVRDGLWSQNLNNIEYAVANGRPLEDYLFPHQDKHIDEWLEGARKNGQFISEHMKGDNDENT